MPLLPRHRGRHLNPSVTAHLSSPATTPRYLTCSPSAPCQRLLILLSTPLPSAFSRSLPSRTQCSTHQRRHLRTSSSRSHHRLPSLCRRNLSRRSSTAAATRPVATHQGPPSRWHALPLPLRIETSAHFHNQRHLHCTSPRIQDLSSASPNPPLPHLLLVFSLLGRYCSS